MKAQKKLIAVLLSLTLIFLSTATSGFAETTADDLFNSCNIMNYSNSRYGDIVYSHLYADDNTVTRTEIDNNCVYVEVFDNSYNLIKSYTVDGELTRICGVYSGETYNFIVCAQDNPEESDECEVVRVIKYSKSWTRIDSASIYGANTTIFADAGSLRFAESDGYLYVRSCHEMYTSDDGRNHQANMTFVIEIESMSVTDNEYIVWNTSSGYVSHSFNQFIAVDETTDSIIAVDHGDAHPRSIVLFRYDAQAGASDLKYPSYIDVFSIAGATGDNTTGVSVGDLIVTENNYIVAFNSIDQDSESTARNAYLAVVSKDESNEAPVQIINLTDYEITSPAVCGYPYITDIGGGKYCVMWESCVNSSTFVSYVIMNENGNMLSAVNSFEAYLSDCEPIYTNGKVIWYSTFNSAPVFYYISTTDYSDAGTDCDTYAPIEEHIASSSWEYDEYFTDDSSVQLTINSDSYIQDIDLISDTYSYGWGYSGKSVSLRHYGFSGTYTAFITLTNGHIIKSSIMIKDCSLKNSLSPASCSHSYRKTVLRTASCETGGLLSYTCPYCADNYEETIDAIGHIDSDSNRKCDNCYSSLYTETTTQAPVTTTRAETTTKAPVTTTKAETTTQAPVTTTKAETTTKAPVTTTKAQVTATQPVVTTTEPSETTTNIPEEECTTSDESTTAQVETTTSVPVSTTKQEKPTDESETISEVITITPPETTTENKSEEVSDEAVLKTENENIIVTDFENKISQITIGTSTSALSETIRNDYFAIVDKNNKKPEGNALVGTGCRIQIFDKNENILSEYTILVMFDVDGNGKITASDARLALRASAKLETLEGVYALSANADGNEKITASDARKILRKSAKLD